jgi:hypothetical protein
MKMKSKRVGMAKVAGLVALPLGLGVAQEEQRPSTSKDTPSASRFRRPIGIDGIWLGMPLKALLVARKNVVRGGAFASTKPIDPNSKHIWLEESVDLAPRHAYQTISYTFSKGVLNEVILAEYFEEDEMASRTQSFLANAMNRYGAPTFLKVVKGALSNRPGIYWRKNNILIEAEYTLQSFRNGSKKRLGFTQLGIRQGSQDELLKRRLFVPLTKAEAEQFLLPVQKQIADALSAVGRDAMRPIPVYAEPATKQPSHPNPSGARKGITVQR